jgi:membrane protein YdbS with pleckstrin-like domain
MASPNWKAVEANYKNQLRFGNTLFLAAFFIAAIAGAIWIEQMPKWIPLTVAAQLFILWFILFVFWAPARARVTSYALEPEVVSFRVGALWHRETAVTHNRLQHIEIERGPVERMLGLSRLKLYTAGGIGSDLTIPGLAPHVSEEIRDNLIAKIRQEELQDAAITDAAESAQNALEEHPEEYPKENLSKVQEPMPNTETNAQPNATQGEDKPL